MPRCTGLGNGRLVSYMTTVRVGIFRNNKVTNHMSVWQPKWLGALVPTVVVIDVAVLIYPTHHPFQQHSNLDIQMAKVGPGCRQAVVSLAVWFGYHHTDNGIDVLHNGQYKWPQDLVTASLDCNYQICQLLVCNMVLMTFHVAPVYMNSDIWTTKQIPKLISERHTSSPQLRPYTVCLTPMTSSLMS